MVCALALAVSSVPVLEFTASDVGCFQADAVAGSNIPDLVGCAITFEAVTAACVGVPVFAISALMWKAFATAVVCIIEIDSEVFSGSADFDDTFELAVKSVPVLAFRNGIGSWSTEAIAEFVRPVCAVVCA